MLSPMNFMEIETGDFVDVMITPDIVARSDGTSVGFSMIKMVVLFKSTEAKVRTQSNLIVSIQ